MRYFLDLALQVAHDLYNRFLYISGFKNVVRNVSLRLSLDEKSPTSSIGNHVTPVSHMSNADNVRMGHPEHETLLMLRQDNRNTMVQAMRILYVSNYQSVNFFWFVCGQAISHFSYTEITV